MLERLLRLNNNISAKPKENSKPIIYNNEDIIFTTCIEIPSGFKVNIISNFEIKYTFDEQFLNLGEATHELLADILNSSMLIKVRAIKIIGPLNYNIIINGFLPQLDFDNTSNTSNSFFTSDSINLNNVICYFPLESNINFDAISTLYNLNVTTLDAVIFTKDGKKENVFYEGNLNITKGAEEILTNNINKKYLLITSQLNIGFGTILN